MNEELLNQGITDIFDGTPVRALKDIKFGTYDEDGNLLKLFYFKGIQNINYTSQRSGGEVLAGDIVWKTFTGGVASVEGSMTLALFSDAMKINLFGYEEVDGVLAAGQSSIAKQVSISFDKILADGTIESVGFPKVKLTEPQQSAQGDQAKNTDIQVVTYESQFTATADDRGYAIYTKENISPEAKKAFIDLVHGTKAAAGGGE